MLVLADGAIEGTVGGGKVEHVVREAAARVLERRVPESLSYELSAELDMGCGGQMTFFIEPIITQPPLLVFGCGHVGTALIRAAAPLGFDIVAVDDFAQNANCERLPEASEIINTYDLAELGQRLPFGEDTYAIILTREHKYDQQLLEFCIEQPTAYLGVIGSPRKARLQRQRLADKGVPPDVIDRVRCPVGMDIGAETPEEIAVAICAQLINVRRGGPKFVDR
jgi:xanthine dehydrogenase accessory factor